ncbi:MAG: lysophospholipid acyltransferase family protein [Eubacteriales bacterium]|nr:lysophospholipid acyltransferase family protein [Eubacteriales bacterium]
MYIKNAGENAEKEAANKNPYPDDPGTHMVNLRHKRKRTVFDGRYSYECNNVFFLIFALFIRMLALAVIPVWAKAVSGYRISGRQNLRKVRGSGVVIIANHVHHLDAPLICGCMNRFRKTRIISLSENFDIPVVGKLIRALGAIPLGGDFAGRQKFNKTIEKLLKKKKHVLFFAEGALWPYYKGIRPFRSGGFRFAARLGVPVLPVVIVFEGMKVGGREKLRLHVGRPLMPEEVAGASVGSCVGTGTRASTAAAGTGTDAVADMGGGPCVDAGTGVVTAAAATAAEVSGEGGVGAARAAGTGTAVSAAALRERTLGYFRRFTSKYYGIQDCRSRIQAEERRGFFI